VRYPRLWRYRLVHSHPEVYPNIDGMDYACGSQADASLRSLGNIFEVWQRKYTI
jgi:hypothetical protein